MQEKQGVRSAILTNDLTILLLRLQNIIIYLCIRLSSLSLIILHKTKSYDQANEPVGNSLGTIKTAVLFIV